MEAKYIVKFASWKTGKDKESEPLSFDEAVELFHLHVNNGERTSIHKIKDNGNRHREKNTQL